MEVSRLLALGNLFVIRSLQLVLSEDPNAPDDFRLNRTAPHNSFFHIEYKNIFQMDE